MFGLFASILVVAGVVGIGALPAESLSISSGPGSPSLGGVSPMILNIGPNGNVLLRGEVVGIPDSDSLTVKSWGGNWTVNKLPTTKVMSLNNALTDFQEGDFVGVLGTVLSDGSFEVDAKIIRKWGRKIDHDHDGIYDEQDSDDDNDGTPDSSDLKPHDHDNDGVDDDQDSDDDDDGVDDSTDGKHGDHDNDGIRDSRDRDDDNDGIPDTSDLKPRNHDNDDKDDDEDEDDDNDGVDDDEDEDDDNDGVDDDEKDDDDNSGSGSGN